MPRFFIKVTLFLLPIGFLFAFPAAVFLLAREGYLIETAVRMQIEDPETLVGRAYTDADNTAVFYKTLLVREKRPSIIALGSSRTMEFRKEFFAEPDRFVNASFSAADLGEIETFVAGLTPQSGVKVILLGLDHRVFRPDYEPPGGVEDPPTMSKFFSDFFAYDWRWIYYDYARGRFSFSELLARSMHTNDIGLVALIDGNGYRGDGSYSYKKNLGAPDRAEALKKNIEETLVALQADRSSFEYASDISPSAIESLERTLVLAKERGIAVVGFLPPYVPALYAEMLSVNDEYRATLYELPVALRALFTKYGFHAFDFSDARILSHAPGEYIDFDHPTDKLDLRMLLYMAERSPALRAYVDIQKAELLITNTPGDFLPFD